MSYILIAIFAWLMLGIVSVIEKHIIQSEIKNPNVLAIYTGLFAVFAGIIFLPFAHVTSWQHVLFDLFCGVIFFLGIWSYFTALKYGEVSEVLPLSGALVPIFTLIIVRFGFGLHFSSSEALAFIVLVSGIIVISYKKTESKKLIFYAILAAIFLAVYYS